MEKVSPGSVTESSVSAATNERDTGRRALRKRLGRTWFSQEIASLEVRRDVLLPGQKTLQPAGNMEAVSLVMRDAEVKSGTDLLVLAAIAHETEIEGERKGMARPSVQKLEALTRISTRTVQRACRNLVAVGELEIDYKAGGEGVNVYRIPRIDGESGRLKADPGVNLRAMHCVMLYSEARGNDLLVQIAIARFVTSHGKRKGSAYPSVATLATLTRLSQTTVYEALDRLRRIGELRINSRMGPRYTSRYTIPMLQHRGARSTDELPLYISILTNDTNNRRVGCSSGTDLTPAFVQRVNREISLRLADWLIASGRKDPDYRTDAESFDWLSGAEYLDGALTTTLPLWMEDRHGFLDRLYEHVVSSDKWLNIRNPRDVHLRLADIREDMRLVGKLAAFEEDDDEPPPCRVSIEDLEYRGTEPHWIDRPPVQVPAHESGERGFRARTGSPAEPETPPDRHLEDVPPSNDIGPPVVARSNDPVPPLNGPRPQRANTTQPDSHDPDGEQDGGTSSQPGQRPSGDRGRLPEPPLSPQTSAETDPSQPGLTAAGREAAGPTRRSQMATGEDRPGQSHHYQGASEDRWLFSGEDDELLIRLRKALAEDAEAERLEREAARAARTQRMRRAPEDQSVAPAQPAPTGDGTSGQGETTHE